VPALDNWILYVDDERGARDAFAFSASELGYRVDTADGGGEALTMSSRHRYSVIATDLRMPTLNGLSLIQLLRPRLPDASYVLVTGASHIELPNASDGSPLVDDVLSKPWSVDELARTLVRALDRYRERRAHGTKPKSSGSVSIVVVNEKRERAAELSEILATCDVPFEFEMHHAESTTGAHELVNGSENALFILDLESESAGGIVSVRELRALSPRAPMLVFGMLDEEPLAQRILEAGAQEYLTKDRLDPYHLRRAIRSAIDRKHAQDRIEFLENHDPVTRLPNRAALTTHLANAIDNASDDGRRVAVLFLDLDRFHKVNASLGPDVGDGLLKVVARRLSQNLRGADSVCRSGGDEFAIVLESFSTDRELLEVAQRLHESLVPPVRLGEYEIATTCSIGIAVFPDHGESAVELLQKADKALHLAKDNGRDSFEVYSPQNDESHSGVLERLHFENGARYALERNEYEVFYQPQATLDQSELVAVEALLRWRHPKIGIVPPAQFIPFLESSGLIRGVGEWVIETASRQVRSWQRAGFDDLRLSVNLSARQFEGDDLVQTIERILNETTFPPDLLELEITESLLLRDTSRTRNILKDLKALGLRIAIDDFGTGHSSLAYLTKFPLDCLKIDRSFVRDITTDEDDRTVAEAIIGLGHNLRLDVVAEGVETLEQLDLLHGCDGFQGFLLSRPRPANEMLALLGRHRFQDAKPVESPSSSAGSI
jgi:diguanylate cyclase (GGDEF)-like protein